MEVIATMSFEQFKAAVTATRKQYSQQNKNPSWKSIVSIVLASFAITAALHTSGEAFTPLGAYLKTFALALFVVVALFLLCKWQAHRCLRKTYEVQKKQLNGQIMNIDESGISGKWENGDATYQYKWSAFESFIDLPDGFLFFPNPVSFVRVPKDSLTLDEQHIIKTWAQAPRR